MQELSGATGKPHYSDIMERVQQSMAVETAMAAVYSECMELFPSDREFFEGLFRDEVRHAAVLHEMGQYMKLGDEDDQVALPPLVLIRRTLGAAQDFLEMVKAKEPSLREVLKRALTLEETIAESFISESKNSSAKDITALLIDEYTHANRIRDLMFAKGYIKAS